MKYEKALRVLLLAVYGAVFFRMFPLWELATDDGKVLMTAENFLRSPELFGPTSSLGVLHPPYVYLYHSLFFLISGSHFWVQAGITAAHLASHWLLIGVGQRLYGACVAYLASLLFFTSPNFLFLYHQRFWEPVLLPLLSMMALAALLRYHRTGEASAFLLCVGSITLASGAHFSSLCLFGLPALALAVRGGVGPAAGALALALVFLAFAPVLAALTWQPLLVALLVAALLAGASLAWRAPGWLNEGNALALGVPVLLAACAIIPLLVPVLDPVRALIRLLNPAGNDAFIYNASSSLWGPGPMVFFPAMLLAYLLRRPSGVEQKLFACWIILPLLPVFAFSAWRGVTPSHWLLLVFPAAWLAAARGLFGFAERFGRSGAVVSLLAAFFLVAAQAARSFELAAHQQESGGIGIHTANLAVKEEVVARIFREPGSPHVALLVNPWRRLWEVDLYGWAYLLRRQETARGNPGGPARGYYIHEPGAGFFQEEFVDDLRDQPGFREERIGPVVLYSTDKPVESAGLRVPRQLGLHFEQFR